METFLCEVFRVIGITNPFFRHLKILIRAKFRYNETQNIWHQYIRLSN